MSKFNHYVKKVDEIAKAAFEEYRKAEAAYKKAEQQRNEYPQRQGMVNAEYAAKSARAQADYLEAKAAFDAAKRAFASHTSEIQAMRKDLAADLEKEYSVNPAALDSNTLELIKSGIMNAGEYMRLLKEAQAAGNHTMARMIGKYAADAAEARGSKYGQNDNEARNLRLVDYEAKANTGNDRLQAFDNMASLYDRCVNNPGMIDHWGEFTAETVENF